MLIKELIPEYLHHLRTLNRSPFTLRDNRYILQRFMKFLEKEQVFDLQALTLEVLEDYQQELAFSLTAKGGLLAIRTQVKALDTVKTFTRFLKDHDYLAHDPGAKIKLPKEPKPLPKVILSLEEVRKLFRAPDMQTNRGYRNRIILEILYDTAIRRNEMTHVRLPDLDLEAGFIHIRQGKGDKERVVPLSQRVCGLVKNYVLAVRSSFIQGDDSGHLVLNRWGRKMDPMAVWAVVHACAKLAGLKSRISTHTLRHTCATHMLRNGAPIRHIQEMLGHESLETTQLYTRVTINDLKEIHAKYHPSEKMIVKGETSNVKSKEQKKFRQD
jgi:integrase/recombinase XerD